MQSAAILTQPQMTNNSWTSIDRQTSPTELCRYFLVAFVVSVVTLCLPAYQSHCMLTCLYLSLSSTHLICLLNISVEQFYLLSSRAVGRVWNAPCWIPREKTVLNECSITLRDLTQFLKRRKSRNKLRSVRLETKYIDFKQSALDLGTWIHQQNCLTLLHFSFPWHLAAAVSVTTRVSVLASPGRITEN